jgi:hypothetical protein
MCGKGSQRRPTLISREREELQWALAYGRITFEQYKRKLRVLKSKRAREVTDETNVGEKRLNNI